MKVICEKCGKDLSSIVDRQFLEYTIDKIACPECHKHQSRYISESDLFLYLLFSEISYLVLCGITVGVFLLTGKSNWVLLLLAPFLFVNLYILREFGRKIYVDGLFKKDFKDYVFKDNAIVVRKSIKYRVIIFYTISVSLLTLSSDKKYLILYVGLSVLETALRYLKSFRKERAEALHR